MASVENSTKSINVTEKPLNDHEAAESTTRSSNEEQHTTGSRADDYYLWEIGGVILSAACIMTIVGLLIWLDGKKLPHWGFTTPEKVIHGKIIPKKTINISLNSVISWISTVGKIAILIPITKGLGQLKWVWFAEQERRLDDLEKFDSATRGLTGSAKLLWRLKGRHFATVGAIAVILALGFDPFIQNLVTYNTVYANSTQEYSNSIVATPVFDFRGAFGELDPTSKGAISAGLYSMDPPSYRVPVYVCDTGNCTWANYPSLAVGVHCTDLTPLLNQTCTGTSVDPTMGAACDHTLPNGMNLGTDGTTVLAMNASREAIHYTNYTNPLAVIQTIAAFNSDFVNASAKVSASECVMFPAVKTYFSAVGQWYTAPWLANQTDDSSNVGPLNTPDFYFENMVDMYEEYTYVPADNNSINAGYFLNPPNSVELSSVVSGFSNGFRMSNQAAVSLQKYLRTLLQGFVHANGTEGTTTVAELNGGGSSDPLQVIYDPFSDSSTCKYVANFWGEFSDPSSTNVQCALDSIAASVTVMMRNAQNITVIPGEDAVSFFGFSNGMTIGPITQINVTWYWIILPIIIWICSIAMLIGTAVKSKKAKVHLWRTNPLAMVFLTLGRDERHEVSQHGGLTEEGLIKRAENIKVKLSVQDGQDIMLRKPIPAQGSD